MVESAGADELGWVKRRFSGEWIVGVDVAVEGLSEDPLGDSRWGEELDSVEVVSNDNGGKNEGVAVFVVELEEAEEEEDK